MNVVVAIPREMSGPPYTELHLYMDREAAEALEATALAQGMILEAVVKRAVLECIEDADQDGEGPHA